MIYTSGDNNSCSNRIIEHTGYSWAENYRNGTASYDSGYDGTRVVEDRSMQKFREELKAKRFADYVPEESRVSRNTNSIYPEYVARQRRAMAEQARMEERVRIENRARLEAQARKEARERMEKQQKRRIAMESAICAVDAENYRKLIALISALVAALAVCIAMACANSIFSKNVAVNDNGYTTGYGDLHEEQLPEETTLTAFAAE